MFVQRKPHPDNAKPGSLQSAEKTSKIARFTISNEREPPPHLIVDFPNLYRGWGKATNCRKTQHLYESFFALLGKDRPILLPNNCMRLTPEFSSWRVYDLVRPPCDKNSLLWRQMKKTNLNDWLDNSVWALIKLVCFQSTSLCLHLGLICSGLAWGDKLSITTEFRCLATRFDCAEKSDTLQATFCRPEMLELWI